MVKPGAYDGTPSEYNACYFYVKISKRAYAFKSNVACSYIVPIIEQKTIMMSQMHLAQQCPYVACAYAATTLIYFLSFVAKEEWSREGQGSDADVVTRSGGDADLDVSQPEMESGEIKVEIDRAVDPFYIPKIEPQSYSKLFIIMQKTDFFCFL